MKQNERLIFYHRTSVERARSILKNGFMDNSGQFLSNRTWTGVWLSSCPPETTDASHDQCLLAVHLQMSEDESARWEFTGEGRSYREWLIPANIINRRANFELVEPRELSNQRAILMDECFTK